MQRFQDMGKPKLMTMTDSEKKLKTEEGNNRRNTLHDSPNTKRYSVLNRNEARVVPIRKSYMQPLVERRLDSNSVMSNETSPEKEVVEPNNKRISKELGDKLINLIYSNFKNTEADIGDKIGQEKFYRELKQKMYNHKSAKERSGSVEGVRITKGDKSEKEGAKNVEKDRKTTEEQIASDFKSKLIV